MCARVCGTHVGVVAGLDGVVALQLAAGPVTVALGSPVVAHAIVIRHLHRLPLGPTVHVLIVWEGEQKNRMFSLLIVDYG